ncbi:hypothetical protein CPLU01_13517 [Colletotrichum plurivorum]|uniref:Uncharacterized protein n=1 Tax=Colletotrichum plurivorum TaxID=2175906 RepID=A0A8H6JQW7_9PEZI|nr:hypothetical protein CPLU01_13517 [Colletotrichum plurivorum]
MTMEPRIIPSQLPPGLEIAIPPGHDLPPQQPMGTYQKKPLPPLPPLRPGFSRQVSAYSVMSVASITTRGSSRSLSRPRTTPSPSPSGQETIKRLENEISTILIQHSPTPVSQRSSVHRSCSPRSRRPLRDEETIRRLAPRRLSTPILSSPILSNSVFSGSVLSSPTLSTPTLALTPIATPCTLHRSSAKIKQITGLDVDYNGFTPTRKGRRSTTGHDRFSPGTPSKSKSSRLRTSYRPQSTSEPARTLSLIDDYDDDSEFDNSDWDFSPSSRRNYASWIPASPVPPRVEILDFDEASPRRRDSEVGVLRSPGMHHFETLPARRNNHMEVSYEGAKDLYHATATSIANSSKKKAAAAAAASSRTSTESGRDSLLGAKNRLSFAAKVLQSGRKRPPTGINTVPQQQSQSSQSQSSSAPAGTGTAAAGSGTGKQAAARSSLHPDMHAHSLDDDRLRVKYSDAISRVFRWSGEHRRAVSEGASPVDGAGSGPGSRSGSGSGTASAEPPRSPTAPPNSPIRMSRRSVQNLAAHVKRTASSMVQSKEERRRENLRQNIRVIPEGSSV